MDPNEITINPEEIRKLPDDSITDVETIRQIALYGIKMNDSSLYPKVKKGFEYAGLYPRVMKPIMIVPNDISFTKVKLLKVEGKINEEIKIGREVIGLLIGEIKVGGSVCIIHDESKMFMTSPVVEILTDNEFRTHNSIYYYEYLD